MQRKQRLPTRGCYVAGPAIPEEREVADTWRAELSEGDLEPEMPADILALLDRRDRRAA